MIKKLDSLFLADQGRRQFTAFHELYNFRRSVDAKVDTFVTEFEHVYYKFRQQDMTLPDTVMAFMLLAASNLTESERQLIMSAIASVSYENMKSVLKRIFCGGITPSQISNTSIQVKTGPVLYENDDNEVMYSRSNNRGKYSGRGAARSNILTGANRHHVGTRGRGRRSNPVGPDGKISRCLICESKFHWARYCPDSYEKNDDEKNSEETVHMSLFVGYTNDDRNSKLEALISESHGCAVLDTGCTTTVCGADWFNSFMNELSDYERSKIVECASNATFTFGDGNTVHSQKKITLPCRLGKLNVDITTDVVNCKIPLLLSNRSMRKARMCIDFGKDTAQIGNNLINLRTSSSSNYLLPIAL